MNNSIDEQLEVIVTSTSLTTDKKVEALKRIVLEAERGVPDKLGITHIISVEYDADARNQTTVKLLVDDWANPKWQQVKENLKPKNHKEG